MDIYPNFASRLFRNAFTNVCINIIINKKKMEKKETPIKTKMDTTGTFRTIKVGNCVTFNEDDVNLESLRTTASYMKRRGIGEYRVEKVTKDNKSAIRVSRIA